MNKLKERNKTDKYLFYKEYLMIGLDLLYRRNIEEFNDKSHLYLYLHNYCKKSYEHKAIAQEAELSIAPKELGLSNSEQRIYIGCSFRKQRIWRDKIKQLESKVF